VPTRLHVCATITVLVALMLAVEGACGGLPDAQMPGPDPSTIGCYVAYAAPFTDFRTWPSNHIEAGADLGDGTHPAGPRTEYLAPLASAEAGTDDASADASANPSGFPQGAIIVMETETNDPTTHHVFAMVKRGCNFNPTGATGWEWFELSPGQIGQGKENILWRGTAPPSDKMYADCNNCHATACASNDSVCTKAFTSQSFADAGSSLIDGGLRD
jgi:hypothetical protein